MWVTWLSLFTLILVCTLLQGNPDQNCTRSTLPTKVHVVRMNYRNYHIPCDLDLTNAVNMWWARNGRGRPEWPIVYTSANDNIDLNNSKTDLIVYIAHNDRLLTRRNLACTVVYQNGTRLCGRNHTISIINILPWMVLQTFVYVEQKVVGMYEDELKRQGFKGNKSEILIKAKDNLIADANYMYTRVNQIYRDAFGVGVTLNRLVILDDNPVHIGKLNDTVDSLAQYLKTWKSGFNQYKEKKAVVVYYTKDTLLNERSEPAHEGLAIAGSACGIENFAILKHNMVYETVLITAHELAHTLSFVHDTKEEGYIMYGKVSQHPQHRWFFSSESKDAWNSAFRSKHQSCLVTHTNIWRYQPVLPVGEITANLADPDNYCSRYLNKTSYRCLAGGLPRPPGAICDQVQCMNTSDYSCKTNRTGAPDGMICGHNKRCSFGKCENHPDKQSALVDDDCVFGDQKLIFVSWLGTLFLGNCSDFIRQHTKLMCKYTAINAMCCRTCKALKTKLDGCAWGDEWRYCINYDRDLICPYMKPFCCEHCHGFKMT